MNVDRLCWRLSSESPLLLQKKQTGPALESTVAFDRSAASGTFPLATNPLYDAIRWTGALCDVHLVVRWQMRWNILSPSACQSASHDLANGADNSIEMQLNWCVDYFCGSAGSVMFWYYLPCVSVFYSCALRRDIFARPLSIFLHPIVGFGFFSVIFIRLLSCSLKPENT